MEAGCKTSRYNFALALPGRTVLYNARTGSVIGISGEDAGTLATHLGRFEAAVAETDIDPAVLALLKARGFVIDSDVDELALIRSAYLRARTETPMVVTITTTMDCNLGCYYCYESRTDDTLSTDDIGHLVRNVRDRLKAHSRTSLHVDWYGGEPLLNVGFIELASAALQQMCVAAGVSYHASIISNGTAWPEDVGAFVAKHQLRQVQISFDGLAAAHNKKRRYRRGFPTRGDGTTFDTVWSLVGQLLEHVRVDVRINLDAQNSEDLLPFVDRAKAAGWFSKPFAAVIQPARLSAYSAKSGFMRKVELSPERFDLIRARLRGHVSPEIRIEESEAPDGVPVPRSSVCAALANDSVVVGADGLLYRCGLQVGETGRAVGALGTTDAADAADTAFWRDFDPTSLPQCAHCSFLPVCWSGCPKKHLEGDGWAIAEQGLYWRHNLPRLIALNAGCEPPSDGAYSEREQFRDGYVPPSPPRRCIPLTMIRTEPPTCTA